ncbi:hypothetical protein [Fibrella forsythiae]|uniref:Secreted protein n=1 Tax=Fibrella forsythiae TaxID=2817061 RepID=A0ABS3JH22_9BACT|nr:hypothetical protein [Fibrella forsythiae]MBO0949305.1 hypothetical protein [Fibrella forsythiae]
MRKTSTYRVTVARLLLLVQLFMLTNAVVFRHAHRLPDGTIVVHAHPFLPKALGGPGSDPVQPNNHSKQELIWLDAMTDVAYPFTEPTFFTFQAPEQPLLPTPTFARHVQVRWVDFTCFSHRGPPLA